MSTGDPIRSHQPFRRPLRPFGSFRMRLRQKLGAAVLLLLAATSVASTAGGQAPRLADRVPVESQVLRLERSADGAAIHLAEPLLLPRVTLEGDAWVDLSQAGDAVLQCDATSGTVSIQTQVHLVDSGGGSAVVGLTLSTGGETGAWDPAASTLRLNAAADVSAASGTLVDGAHLSFDLPARLAAAGESKLSDLMNSCFGATDGSASSDAAEAAVATLFWQVYSTPPTAANLPRSSLTMFGAERFFTSQSIGTGTATSPYNWKTLSNLVFPTVNVAFGQSLSFSQVGTAQGRIETTGKITLEVPLRLTDSNGHQQTFTVYLTTERTNGTNSDGSPICNNTPSDGPACQGNRRDANGYFRMVAIVNVPVNGGTLGSGEVVFYEISGNLPNGDSDGDGFPDASDNCPSVANAGQEDQDGDGVGNVCDNCSAVANASQANNDGDAQGDACDTDDDNDGIADTSDNCPLLANPTQTNTDGDSQGDACDTDDDNDGVTDGSDNCPLVSNSTQANTDGDSLGNACDACPNDAQNDVDGDTRCGDVDNCPTTANADQANADGDAQGDVCDPDDDNDGVLDATDNCRTVANPSQSNNDGDAQGDACDTDDDNDGVLDTADNCPLTSNASQANNDGDAQGDACDTDDDNDGVLDTADNCPTAANANQANSDGDAQGDVCDADDDNDGVPDTTDNCRTVANAGQANADGDALGDACDPCPGDTINDADADGICGSVDNCPSTANPDQADRDGDGVGDACDPIRVNFGTPTAAIPAGFQKDDGTAFSATRGYGWESLPSTRERVTAQPLEYDTFAFTQALRGWNIEVPNGEYDVHLVSGDSAYAAGPHRVRAQNLAAIQDVTTAANTFTQTTKRSTVRNGRLRLELGGTTGNTMLNFVELLPVSGGPSYLRSFHFRPSTSVSPAGFEADTGLVFSAGRGFGWDAAVATRDRARQVPQVLDTFALAVPTRKWELAIPNGFYDVWLGVGDSQFAQGPQKVTVEGTLVVNNEPVAAAVPIERQVGVRVTDGRLTVQIGNGTDNTCLNYVVVAAATADADGDGIANETDNCPFAANASQTDGDHDGIGDLCDPDRDGDGVLNVSDNCPDLSNSSQTDGDADTLGDACDPCPGDVQNDPDGDGVCGAVDNCPDVVNPAQTDADGDGVGDVCEFLRVDFGPSTAGTGSGYKKDDGSVFSVARQYGWSSAVSTRERLTPAPVELDTFALLSAARNWTAEIPNGNYQVRVNVGDTSYAQGPQRVDIEGVRVVNDVSTAVGVTTDTTVNVAVRGGRLRMDVGGTAGNTCLTLVEATQTAGPAFLKSVNFQNPTSARPLGWLVDTGAVFDATRGYGWNTAVQSRERNKNVPQVLDTLVFTSAIRTWEMTVPNGFYEVWTSVGDSENPQGPHRVIVEGNVAVNNESTAANKFLERRTGARVTDGRLSVYIGGGGGNTTLNYVVIATAGPDLDGDGVANATDNCPFTANANQTDTNGNGIGDVCDFDQDGDGVGDGIDNCPTTPNTDQLNSDGDTQGDACDTDDDNDGRLDTADNCPAVYNPTQSNSDGDAFGDACDPCPSDAANDADQDGRCANVDNCPTVSNSDQVNTDGDSQGDACDTDDDNDGVLDTADNCRTTANANQTNTDGDAQGDACDSDDDNDTIPDGSDNCPLVANANQTNTDGDAQGDACDSDDDNDTIPDASDNCPLVANTNQTNTDGDAQGDACDSDDDNDTIPDASDNCPLVANTNQANTDGDSQGNACDTDDDNDGRLDTSDNCPLVANADQANTDGDSLGNACDNCPSDPNNDVDGDTVCGNVDNCPTVSNANQTNTDGDSQGDACDTDDDNDGVPDVSDNCTLVANGGQQNNDGDAQGDACDTDDDNDGVPDTTDNCPFASNPTQTDTDGDHIGDACDSCPSGADSDGDGICDATDNCPSVANPTQTNTDGDTRGDVCDNCPTVSNSNQLDSDSDGFGNVCDNCPSNANPTQVNTDGDAQGNACDTDDDNDGILDGSDNCSLVPNADQRNTDGDAQGDACDSDDDNDGRADTVDNCPLVANANQADNDSDGIGNACDVEDCDGIDNDGDGLTDEGFDVGTACNVGIGGCQRTGVKVCTANHAGTVCNATPGTPAPNDATCNGVDDDCDGLTDENYVSTPTTCGTGACARNGTTSCVSGAVVDSCSPGQPAPSDTTCNGIDDDCDGTVDENYVSVPTACGTGACARNGSTSCVSGAVVDSCSPGQPAPSDTVCNGIDDDCDGSVDENYVATPTSCGLGVCASTGQLSCVNGSEVDSCAPGAGDPAETCGDNLDNNCNGTIDEGC